MQLFFAPDVERTFSLPEEESWHCAKVLRNRNNDVIHITDGAGNFFEARILDAHPKHCLVKLLHKYPDPSVKKYFLHIAIAPTKNLDRMEWFVEKSTEIGIDKITFLECEHSERVFLKIERMQKVAIQALKQSQRATLPVIEDTIAYEEFLKQDLKQVQKIIAHLQHGEKNYLHQNITSNFERYCIAIGPEGDFSGKEIQLAIEEGFLAASLGNIRLRTETAGLVACHTVALCKQMML